MTQLGKIFIYEENPKILANANTNLKTQGFFAFGTDNIYQFLKYAAVVHPDIVIMDMPQDFAFDDAFWTELQKSLCQKHCPEIYINADPPFSNNKALHITKFNKSNINPDELTKLVKETHNHLSN